MTKLLLHINNYSITGAITTYQTYPSVTDGHLGWTVDTAKQVKIF